jgi:photosystem II stability/assembly factor-like uncharacterized protein
VWKTTNGGANWRPTSDELTNLAVNSLVMDPADSATLLAGTGEGYFRELVRGTALPLRGGGIFVSHDTGDSWSLLPATATSDFYWVNDLVYGTTAQHNIYAATRTGVWRSIDEGVSWSLVLDPVVNGGCLDLAIKPSPTGDTLFASCGTLAQASVYRTLQADATSVQWEEVLTEPEMGLTTLAIAPSNPDVIYALSARNADTFELDQSLLAVFRSTAGGAAGSWEAMVRPSNPAQGVAATILTNPIAGLIDRCDPAEKPQFTNMGWYANVIAVDPVDENRVWAAGVDLFRSDDGGRTWGFASYWWANEDEPSYVHADQHLIVFHPAYDGTNNRTMFATNDGGIARTDDATAPIGEGITAVCQPKASLMHFTSLSTDFGVTQFYHGASVGNARTYVAGAQDNGTLLGSDALGKNQWRRINGGDGGYVAVDPTNPSIIYVSSQVGRIRKSVDGGETYVQGTTIPDDKKFLFIAPFVIDNAHPSRLWTGGEQIWRTENGAFTWIPSSTVVTGRVSAIAVKPENSNVVVAGTSSGTIYRHTNATSTDAATEWSSVKPRGGFVSSIAFDPYETSTAYATYAGFGGAHVWRSRDDGATWSAIDGAGDGALPDIPVHSILIDPTRPGRLYIGTDLGVLVSTDGGASWMEEFTGFPNVVTEWLTCGSDVNGVSMLAFTHGRGVWKVELGSKRKRGVRRG